MCMCEWSFVCVLAQRPTQCIPRLSHELIWDWTGCGLKLWLEQFITPYPILTESPENMWHTPHFFPWPFTSPVHEHIVLSEVINKHTRELVYTQVRTRARVHRGRSNHTTARSNLITSDSGHAGHMPFLQWAQWQTPVRFAAVPAVHISTFVLTPDAAELFIPLLFFLHSSFALSCTPLRLSLSLELSACCLICYEGAISLKKTVELCLICACQTLTVYVNGCRLAHVVY